MIVRQRKAKIILSNKKLLEINLPLKQKIIEKSIKNPAILWLPNISIGSMISVESKRPIITNSLQIEIHILSKDEWEIDEYSTKVKIRLFKIVVSKVWK